MFSLPATSRYFHRMCTKYLVINRCQQFSYFTGSYTYQLTFVSTNPPFPYMYGLRISLIWLQSSTARYLESVLRSIEGEVTRSQTRAREIWDLNKSGYLRVSRQGVQKLVGKAHTKTSGVRRTCFFVQTILAGKPGRGKEFDENANRK